MVMWITMHAAISGSRWDNEPWPAPGVPFMVQDWEGVDLLLHGHASKALPPYPEPGPATPPPSPPPPVRKPAPVPPPPLSHPNQQVVSEPASTAAGPVPPGPVTHPNQPVTAKPVPPAPVADEDVMPAPNAPKQDWVAHAVSKGASPGEAASLTKNQLQAAYGGRL